MRNGLIAILAAGAIVAVAIFEGIRSNRWGTSEDMKAAAAKLERIPNEFGPWIGTESPMDEKIIRIAEAVGNVSRKYQNRKNGDQVSVLLLCGPTGPIGAHTPEVCYAGLGFACKGKPTRKSVVYPSNGAGSFWTARFEKNSFAEEALQVYWAWSTNGDWEASTNPRADFALRSVLYKMQVQRGDYPSNQVRDPNKQPIELFLNDFLPIVKNVLSSAPG